MKEALPKPSPTSSPASVTARQWWTHVRTSDTVRYFIGKGAYLMPLNFLGQALGFVSAILYAHFLSPAQYGRYSYVYSTVGVLSFLSLPGIATAITQAAAQDFDGFFSRGTRVRLRFSLVGCIAIVAIGFACWRSKGNEIMISFLLAAVLFPFFYAMDSFWSVLSAKKQFERLATFRAIQMLCVASMTWTVVVLTQWIPLVFLANFGTTALTNLIFYRWTLRHQIHNDRVRPDSLGYGKRLSVLNVLYSIESRIDNVMLGTFLPFQTLGWFTMADRLDDASTKGLWTITSQMLFPRLAEVNEAEARRRVRVWGVYFWAGFLVVALLFWLLAPWVLPIILGSKYQKSIELAKWLVLFAAIGTPAAVFEVYCQARVAEKSLWLLRISMTAAHLGTLPWMLKLWGVYGVVASISVSRVVPMLASFLLFKARVR
ncbi:MAG TPA: oligosaccharide flippase family protein [Verrucomicrobiae bacterium]|nr:oligosaccharide flippase family protein [Verrucomicrobiae bacterium]